MDIQTARNNIGKEFKHITLNRWDIILAVTDDGMIIGVQMEAPCEDCRLKEEVPPALKKDPALYRTPSQFNQYPKGYPGFPATELNDRCDCGADPVDR